MRCETAQKEYVFRAVATFFKIGKTAFSDFVFFFFL